MLSTALAALLGGLVGGSHGGVQRGKLTHHALVGLLLVSVNGLCMLAEIVETRELLSAMTSERTFTSVLSGGWMGGEPGTERGTEEGQGTTDLMCLARCSLLLKTMRQSP
jgi:hypothetical protein